MKLFDRGDIEKSFDKAVFSRGLDYFRTGQVLKAWINSDREIGGTVRGTSHRPYRVTIAVIPRSKAVYLEATCSCPYEHQCKHAAAVALHLLAHEIKADFSALIERVEQEEEKEELDLPKFPQVAATIPLPAEVREWLSRVESARTEAEEFDPAAKVRVFYNLGTNVVGSVDIPSISPVTRSILKTGVYGAAVTVKMGTVSARKAPKGWLKADASIIFDLDLNAPKFDYQKAEFRIDGKHGIRLLREVILTGRCTWEGGQILKLGAPRTGSLAWEAIGKKGQIKPRIRFEGEGKVLATNPPWYVDLKSGECGPLDCDVPADLAAAFVRGGPVGPEHISEVRGYLWDFGIKGAGLPDATHKTVIRNPEPVPCFVIEFEACQKKADYWSPHKVSAPIAFGKLTFEYEGHRAPADGSDIREVNGEEITIVRRHPTAELAANNFLQTFGWRDTKYSGWDIPTGRGTSLCIVPPDSTHLFEPLERVTDFVKNYIPKLKESGWKIEVAENFRFVPEEEVEFDVGLDGDSQYDWFGFRLGIRVEDQALDLRPILAHLFKELGSSAQGINAALKRQKSDDMFVFGTNGQAIRLSRKRLAAILQPLVELFGNVSEWPENLRIAKALLPDTEKLKEAVDAAGVPWKTSDEIKRLEERFATFDHLEHVSEPDGFLGELRPYQREGLAWLQFLREYGFGGVLADDMGLGKTVQVLAHIQTEKVSGRMVKPCLIVAPTSTMPNWRREAERFVPNLKVITLQGLGRAEKFIDLPNVDIALTTYPLLARDKGLLQSSAYHLVVLDEAQNVKNPITAAAKAARELVARHKICLSGTPVENHLGELWALFHFLMPSFLGSDSDFKKRFRNPIERFADKPARDRLARRIRPFMLRRTKSQVVTELPPKTEIIETVEFDDPQRDLYESIRVAMDAQVRKLIESQGFDKSRIQILDALLKLRQVCCDPRLVKLPSAKDVTSSAKLDRLMEMLSILIEDGRKVLLFSQFTSMLDLIEERLRAANIDWVRISGDTVDRDTPVRQFQAGDVPLFLISLKAGGTGLNLTAADTVILYDPWWNPAVENQAIDRAHRIGQVQSVNVYKMVAAGTIEEKMLEMQARKGDIARSILTDDAEGIRTLTADDLRWVLSKD